MADRIYKGRVIVTGACADSNRRAFPEAAKEFNLPHAGGLIPFELLSEVTSAKDFTSKMINGDLWLTGDEVWIRIEKDGHIEIGISGV